MRFNASMRRGVLALAVATALLPLGGCSLFRKMLNVHEVDVEYRNPESETGATDATPTRAADTSTSVTAALASGEARIGNPEQLGEAAQLEVGRTFDPLYFDDDRTDLSALNRRQLAEYADWLRDHPRVWITLAGHSDEAESVRFAYNEGMARAIACREFFIAQGLDGRRFYPMSYGRDRVQQPGVSREAIRVNNRVELHAFVAPAGVELPTVQSANSSDAPASVAPAPPPPTRDLGGTSKPPTRKAP